MYTLHTPRRANENVASASAFIYDIDEETTPDRPFELVDEEVRASASRLQKVGVEFLLYSSYNHHRVKENPPYLYVGYRLVVPLLAPLTSGNLPVDYRRAARAFAQLHKLVGNDLALSQPWFLPSRPDETIPAVYQYSPGLPVDWTTLTFERAPPLVPILPEDCLEGPPKPVVASEFTLRLFRNTIKSPPAVFKAVQYFLEGKVPAPGEIKSRHAELVLPLTLAVARTSEPGESFDDLFAVIEPWARKLEAVYPRGGAGWSGEFARALRGALDKVPQWRAQSRVAVQRDIDQLTARLKARAAHRG